MRSIILIVLMDPSIINFQHFYVQTGIRVWFSSRISSNFNLNSRDFNIDKLDSRYWIISFIYKYHTQDDNWHILFP